MIAPVLEELATEKGDDYLMASVNVGEQRDLAVDQGITAVPTFQFYADGELKETHLGMLNKQGILDKLEGLSL